MKQSRQPAFLIGIFLVSFLLSGIVSAQKKSTTRKSHTSAAAEAANFSAVDSLVQEQVNTDAITGAVLVVGHNGRVVHQKAFGARAVSPRREPMTLDTIF